MGKRRYPNTEFDKLNAKHFGGRLPKYRVRWKPDEKMRGLIAYADFEHHEIGMNATLKGWQKIWFIYLLHEMAHIEQQMIAPKSTPHGRIWAGIMRRLAQEGAFDYGL